MHKPLLSRGKNTKSCNLACLPTQRLTAGGRCGGASLSQSRSCDGRHLWHAMQQVHANVTARRHGNATGACASCTICGDFMHTPRACTDSKPTRLQCHGEISTCLPTCYNPAGRQLCIIPKVRTRQGLPLFPMLPALHPITRRDSSGVEGGAASPTASGTRTAATNSQQPPQAVAATSGTPPRQAPPHVWHVTPEPATRGC
jgi:hypothetical protein